MVNTGTKCTALAKLTRFDERVTQDVFLGAFALPLSLALSSQLLVKPCGLTKTIETGNVSEIIRMCNKQLLLTDDPKDTLTLRSIRALYEKQKDLKVEGCDPASEALKEFIRCEIDCARENELLCSLLGNSRTVSPLPEYSKRANKYLYLISRKVSDILGEVPSFGDLKFKFGPGATLGLPKRLAFLATKLSLKEKTCSKSLLPHLDELSLEMPHLAQDIRNCVPKPCKVSFVAKNYKTKRAIAVEPWLNTLVQLGIGNYISSRLRFSGVDIRDQTRNQRLAEYGSKTGEVSTIDLSSASDTIPYEFVRQVLPDDWFKLLVSSRSDEAVVNGVVFRPQKFSSMGNGFTFPLETLLFHAISLVCAEERAKSTFFCSTYGDDMIVPSESYHLTLEVLELFGFRPNKEKSYTAPSRFRESCGTDFLDGHSVRPTYARDNQIAKYLFQAHNRYLGTHLEKVFSHYTFVVCRGILLFGPRGYGDGHLHIPELWPRGTKNRKRGWGGSTFKTYVSVVKQKSIDLGSHPCHFILPLYETYAGSSETATRFDKKDRMIYDTHEVLAWEPRTLYTFE